MFIAILKKPCYFKKESRLGNNIIHKVNSDHQLLPVGLIFFSTKVLYNNVEMNWEQQ